MNEWKIWKKRILERLPRSRFGTGMAVAYMLPALYLFVAALLCSHGLLGCDRGFFLLLAPIYLFIAGLSGHLSAFWFLIMFIAASSIYTTVLYSLGDWFERIVFPKFRSLVLGAR